MDDMAVLRYLPWVEYMTVRGLHGKCATEWGLYGNQINNSQASRMRNFHYEI